MFKRVQKIVIIIVLCWTSYHVNAQHNFWSVDLPRIEHKKVREYLELHQTLNFESLSTVSPSYMDGTNPQHYQVMQKEYHVKENIDKVWHHYIYTNPGLAWNTAMVSFGMLFSKNEHNLSYPGDPIERIDSGQVIYLNLKLIYGIKNLAMAFEITNIDSVNHVVEFSYLKGNASEGKQKIQFIEAGPGRTSIIHTSRFKSESAFRDKHLYPFFHNQLCDQFHRNLRRMILADPNTDNDISMQ